MLLVVLSSCTQPFHETDEGVTSMKALLEEQFGSNGQLCDVTLFYDGSVGNSISAFVKVTDRPNMMANWVYLNTPVHVGRQLGRRSVGRFQVGSIGGWDNRNEQFIDPKRHVFFTVDEVKWELIPRLYEIAEKDMAARGVHEPVMQMILLSKSSGRVTATVIATTMGGGSSMTYEFDMEGNMVRQPG
jgi:hypothetical protein